MFYVDHNSRNLDSVIPYTNDWRKTYKAFWEQTRIDALPIHNPDDFVGKYTNSVYGQVSVNMESDDLNLTFESGILLPLRHYIDNTFATETDNMSFSHASFTHLKVKFEVSKNGTISTFTMPLEGGVEDFRFKR